MVGLLLFRVRCLFGVCSGSVRAQGISPEQVFGWAGPARTRTHATWAGHAGHVWVVVEWVRGRAEGGGGAKGEMARGASPLQPRCGQCQWRDCQWKDDGRVQREGRGQRWGTPAPDQHPRNTPTARHHTRAVQTRATCAGPAHRALHPHRLHHQGLVRGAVAQAAAAAPGKGRHRDARAAVGHRAAAGVKRGGGEACVARWYVLIQIHYKKIQQVGDFMSMK